MDAFEYFGYGGQVRYIDLGSRIIYISFAGALLHNVGRVKCQPFLKRTDHWK